MVSCERYSMQLGILLNNLGPSQLAYLAIRNNNLFVDKRPDIDCILFYENFYKPCLPGINVAIMHISEAWNYQGILVSTCLDTTEKLISFPGTKNKFFYVWDLEWLRLKQKHFRALQNIYGSNELFLIARSAEHSKLLSNCWNVGYVPVVDDLNMEALLKVVTWNSQKNISLKPIQ